MRARLTGIAAVGTVAAIIAAQIRQRDENFSRIGNDAGTILLLQSASGGQQFGESFAFAAQQLHSNVAGQWLPFAHFLQTFAQVLRRHIGGCLRRDGSDKRWHAELAPT